jgi:hypothetical protein
LKESKKLQLDCVTFMMQMCVLLPKGVEQPGKFNVSGSGVRFRIEVRFARCRLPMNGLAGCGIFLVDRGQGVLIATMVWCLVCLSRRIDAIVFGQVSA